MIGILESDNGTKKQAYTALAGVHKEIAKEYAKAVAKYWKAVWERARMLCLQYGAYDTGTLFESIRLVWDIHPQFGLYEVAVSSEGAEATGYIRVGGGTFMNPKTGRVVDYAQVVHDGGPFPRGGGHYQARPFLTDAIDQLEGYRESLMMEHVDKAINRFKRVQ